MKRILFFLCLFPLTMEAVDRERLDEMLTRAAASQDKAYLEAREVILRFGKEAVPMLLNAATDARLTWQQRLIARICYERIVRTDDIEKLRRYDWFKDPGYDPQWAKNILGPEVYLGKIVVPKCVEMGLWYYYIEMNWKWTREYSYAFMPQAQKNIWASWCTSALKDQPERYYFVNIMIEKVESDPDLFDLESVVSYKYLLKKKESHALPVLVKRYDAYFKRQVTGPEVFPGAYQSTYKGMFKTILDFSDSQHADLLEKFIAERPALAPLKEQVAEIRKRPAPPPRVEPPFRLGQELVKP